mgnify:CR=1 FL=1
MRGRSLIAGGCGRGAVTRLPAEWEAHAGTAMCWPARADMWGGLFADAEAAHAEVIVDPPQRSALHVQDVEI